MCQILESHWKVLELHSKGCRNPEMNNVSFGRSLEPCICKSYLEVAEGVPYKLEPPLIGKVITHFFQNWVEWMTGLFYIIWPVIDGFDLIMLTLVELLWKVFVVAVECCMNKLSWCFWLTSTRHYKQRWPGMLGIF